MGENLKKKAVVIGATGNLGREICKELRKLNFDIDKTWTSKKRPDVLSKNAFKKLPNKIHTAIYVAGINKVCPFNKFSTEDFNKVIEIGTDPSIEEASDMYEVLIAIIQLYGYDLDTVMKYAGKKRFERGGFSQGVILKAVNDEKS